MGLGVFVVSWLSWAVGASEVLALVERLDRYQGRLDRYQGAGFLLDALVCWIASCTRALGIASPGCWDCPPRSVGIALGSWGLPWRIKTLPLAGVIFFTGMGGRSRADDPGGLVTGRAGRGQGVDSDDQMILDAPLADSILAGAPGRFLTFGVGYLFHRRGVVEGGSLRLAGRLPGDALAASILTGALAD